ncbi:hypothetical protein KA005_01635, partial [bacterium]|nr:hypothetical protein [bacterium]
EKCPKPMTSKMMQNQHTKNIFDEFKYYILSVIIAIAVIVVLKLFPTEICPVDNARYILSAISQSLAALLALVFTITLVAAQMTRRYSAMDKIIFRSETICLMSAYGIGIILPVLMLKFGFWYKGVVVSIFIATFCVFSLFPFLRGVNTTLREIGIDNLVDEAEEAIYSGFEAKAINRVVELKEIGEDIVKRRREKRAVQIVNGLVSIGTEALDNKDKEFEKLISCVVKTLSSMGSNAANNKLDDVILKVGQGLEDIGVAVAIKQWILEMQSIIIGLERIGSLAAENNIEATHRMVIGLWVLGAAAKEYLPECVGDVIRSLKKLERNGACFDAAKNQINYINAIEMKFLYEFKDSCKK